MGVFTCSVNYCYNYRVIINYIRLFTTGKFILYTSFNIPVYKL